MSEKQRKPDLTPATVPMLRGDFIQWVKVVIASAANAWNRVNKDTSN